MRLVVDSVYVKGLMSRVLCLRPETLTVWVVRLVVDSVYVEGLMSRVLS